MSKQERYRVAGYGLHIAQERGGGDWSVWLNTEVADYDGLCIGLDSSREAAMTQAIEVTEQLLAELKAKLELKNRR
jgi:hypothetical protein